MTRILQCFNQLVRPCGRRRLVSSRKLLWLIVLLCITFVTVALHAFSFHIMETIGNNVVRQHSHLSNNSEFGLSTTTIARLMHSVNESSARQEPVDSKSTKSNEKKINKTENSSRRSCHSWCRSAANASKPFFLTAVLLVRIYVKDLPQLSTRELRQWFYYLRYAGFQHAYVYDAYVMKNESQAKALKSLIDEGFVTYTDWSHKAYPYSISGTQLSAYQDCIDRFGHDSVWQAAIDMDEYPFSPKDKQPFFVQRAVAQFSENNPTASELTMQNFLFLGKPIDDSQRPMLMDRIWRRTHGPANALVKPIYKPLHVGSASVHHNSLAKGHSINFPVDLLRMNHYWGARLQNWGDDTPEIIEKTQPDNSMESIVKTLQDCISECVPSTEYLYRKEWN